MLYYTMHYVIQPSQLPEGPPDSAVPLVKPVTRLYTMGGAKVSIYIYIYMHIYILYNIVYAYLVHQLTHMYSGLPLLLYTKITKYYCIRTIYILAHTIHPCTHNRRWTSHPPTASCPKTSSSPSRSTYYRQPVSL